MLPTPPNYLFVLTDDGRPVECADALLWATWMKEHHDQRVLARHAIRDGEVSTVFLGCNHGFDDGPPILYETMVFEGGHDGWMDRYYTRKEALAGHQRILVLCGDSLPLN